MTQQFQFRRATAADVEAIAAFSADILRHQDANEPDARTGAWAGDLAAGRHPTFAVENFLVVEDTRTARIASSLCLIPQIWSYAGLEMKVGIPELVGTHPDYRGQGLVRRQFEEIHRWSAARGELVLAIDGIPWFYRQFGYDMALALRGGCSIDAPRVPALASGASEPYRVRPAGESDIPLIARTYAAGSARDLVAACRDDASWRYELHGRSATSMYAAQLRVIEARDGQPAGMLAHTSWLQGAGVWVIAYELTPGTSWDAVTPTVLRYLRGTADVYAARDANGPCTEIGFWFGAEHPVHATLDAYAPRPEPPYAWYLRVPDLPRLLRHIAPVLEQRLTASSLAGHRGELRISFYRDGLRLGFRDGRLTEVAPWRPSLALRGVERLQRTAAARPDAFFPDLTFLQLLFGYRALNELEYAFADCLVRTDESRALLLTLFPKQPSNVWPVL